MRAAEVKYEDAKADYDAANSQYRDALLEMATKFGMLR